MAFLAEILAVAVVWLSSFALCQFGVATETRAHKANHAHAVKTVARSPRADAAKPQPVSAATPAVAPKAA
ncbi:hypothetical protein [Caulobacter segnis]|uniref:Uncharacterized protein n=2 Tax=Caulobacter segnis TaxID=88688 RepID=D5VG30_CAUST|nr:hypothetical protein [Caulobacter segnis]ADG10033.1 conserved hypothetical protein [Caulobacter segnis ATCC 21756]